MSQTSTLIQDNNKNVIKTHMNNIYTNYFYDNKEVVRYLKNIDNSNNLNWFDTMILRIFKFKVPEQVLGNDHFYTFINGANGQIKSTGRYESYRKIIKVLSTVIAVLYDIVMEGDKTNYKTITSLTFTSSDLLDISDCTPKTTESKTSEYNSINYCLKSDGSLYIRINGDDFSAFTGINKNTLVYNPTSDLEADIGKNYIFFMLNFADNNLEKQIAAFYYYMQIINDCFKFYTNLERMVISHAAGSDSSTILAEQSRSNVCVAQFSKMSAGTSIYKYEEDFITLSGEIETFMKENTRLPLSDLSTCTSVCPVEFTLSSSNIYMKNLPDDFEEHYAIRVDSDKYDITRITEQGVTVKYLNKVEIKATNTTSSPGAVCDTYPTLNINLNDKKTIYFEKKSVDELRNEYNDIGDKLDNINENIGKTKDKINSQVKQYDAQSSILKALDTREYVYYAIFGVVGVVLLILLLIDTQQSTKTYASLTILIVLLAMNIINYYLKYDYIEHFEVAAAPASDAPASGAPASDAPASGDPASGAPASGAPASGAPASGTPASGAPASGAPASGAPASGAPASGAPASGAPASGAPASGAPASGAPASTTPPTPPTPPTTTTTTTTPPAYTPPVSIQSCTDIQDGWQLSQKVNIMNPHIQQYTNRMIKLLEKLKALLSSLNTEDFLSKIATSLKNEKRTYEEHSKVYKQRTEINKKSIDVMKHEMINKNAYINMITITSFVIVFVYVMFMLDPSYVNVYLIIGTILILINLAVYYILILHPVRTKSRNKYWYKPSKSTMQMIT
jgi:hypothetical protein